MEWFRCYGLNGHNTNVFYIEYNTVRDTNDHFAISQREHFIITICIKDIIYKCVVYGRQERVNMCLSNDVDDFVETTIDYLNRAYRVTIFKSIVITVDNSPQVIKVDLYDDDIVISKLRYVLAKR